MSGEITKAPPPRRAIPAWDEDNVRRDGLKNNTPGTFPSSALGSGRRSSCAAKSSSAVISSKEKSARSLKRCIGKVPQGAGQVVDMSSFQYERRQEAQHIRIPARSRKNVALEQSIAHGCGARVRGQAEQESRAVNALDGTDYAGAAYIGRHVANARQEVITPNRIDGRAHGRACHRAAAERRAELAGAQALGDLAAHEHGAGRESARETFCGRENVRHDAGELRAERLPEAPHAGLDFVENQQRADALARVESPTQKRRRQIVRAGESLHGLGG